MNQPVEAEVVQEQALVRREAGGLATISDLEQSFALAVKQRELLSDYIKKQLVPGKHFFQRGDQKPSLTKEGAEIILLPHNLAPDYELISGPEAPPDDNRPYQITVKCTLRRKGDQGSFVGSGLGSAGSDKGSWEGKGDSRKWIYQPRQTDKYLCHNATMKMAQKSAMIAATINSTAASEFFTQDIDDGGGEAPAPAPKTPVPPKPKAPQALKPPTDATRKWMMEGMKAMPGMLAERLVTEFFQKIEPPALLPTEKLSDVPLEFVPNTPDTLRKLGLAIADFEQGGIAKLPYPKHDLVIPPSPGGATAGGAPDPATAKPKPVEVPRDPNPDPNAENAPWRSFPVPFGSDAGVKLEDLDKNKLFGWWANYEVSLEYNGKKKKPETIAKDRKFRAMLDEAGKHYEFKKRDEDDVTY